MVIRGWRAWVSFLLTFITLGLSAIGILKPDIANMIAGLLGTLGLWFLADKGKRIESKLDDLNSQKTMAK
jgi:hypothetical protein